MEDQNQAQVKAKKPQSWLMIAGAVLVIVAAVFTLFRITGEDRSQPEVITVSTLEKIINVSELSTFTAVYNGIAEVMNEKKPEEIDYHVSYEAQVDAGIDFEKIAISVDNEAKTITVDIPEISITDIRVDIASLDFIFLNDKANASSVTQEALKACEDDVQREIDEQQRETDEQQPTIYDLAKQNAENVLTALIHPMIEQLDAEYTLVFD